MSLTDGVINSMCSILVRSTEWSKIKANLPWLLDAAACVALDTFVSFFVTQTLILKLIYMCLPLTRVIITDHNAVCVLQIPAKEK